MSGNSVALTPRAWWRSLSGAEPPRDPDSLRALATHDSTDDVTQRPTRLSRSRDVRLVLRRGRRRAGRLLAAHVLDTDRGTRPRLAVIASRRVGNAVERNRAKRLLREAGWRIEWSDGTDVVLVARPGIVGVGVAAVRHELETLLERPSR